MLRKVLGYYIHIGVGFEVACLSELGKFDGLKSEMSNKCESHAFFVPNIGLIANMLEVRDDMILSTLSNVETRGGEENPPCVRLAPYTIPKAKSS